MDMVAIDGAHGALQEGNTAAHVAAMKNSAEALHVMLIHNINANLARGDFWTPLHVAAAFNSDRAVAVLLAHGADSSRKSKVCNRNI